MILHGELAVGSLQGCGIGVALDAQSVVVVLHGFARCPHGSVSKVGLHRRPEARGGRIAAAPASRRHCPSPATTLIAHRPQACRPLFFSLPSSKPPSTTTSSPPFALSPADRTGAV